MFISHALINRGIKVKPIRVLHVLSSMDYAGTETLLMNLYRNINRDTIQFDFAVCADHTGDYDHEIECLGGKIIHYPKYTVKNHLSYKKWWNSFFETHKEYKITEYLRQGFSFCQIGRCLKVHRTTVRNFVHSKPELLNIYNKHHNKAEHSWALMCI